MKAVSYPALGEVNVSKIHDPKPGADEIVVQVRSSGICHTDIDILHGRYGNSTFPIVPGHEFSGEIVDLGAGVSAFSTGDRVVIDPNFHCDNCRPCNKGLYNLCESLGAYGVTKHGGLAEYSVVHQDNAIAFDDLSYHVAALAEPVGCVLNGLGVIETKGVENALVFGAGPIGMLLALALRTRGVNDITMVDVDESRLTLAESFHLKAIAAGSDSLKRLDKAVDLVIDATGVPNVTKELVDYTANGGSILIFGVCPPSATIAICPHDIFRRQIRIAGAHSLNHNIPEALKTIEQIGPEIAQLISHRVPLNEISAFLTGSGESKTLKVQAEV